MMKIYGIKNCDTVKKALNWLDSNKLTYEFIDFKKTPPTSEQLLGWKKDLGDFPVNPKGRNYKTFEAEYLKASEPVKIQLMIKNTSMIKRPLITLKNQCVSMGYNEAEFRDLFLGK